MFSIGRGFERLFFFMIFAFMVIHIIACLWIFFASFFNDDFKDTWMESKDINQLGEQDLYLISIYWAVTTISTVGYGDISANNRSERIFCLIVMIIGVTMFTTAASTITQLMSSIDEQENKFQEKI